MSEISPRELSARLGEESILVLDVREPWEYALCAIAGSRLVPLQSLPDELGDLDPAQTIVTVCHHGMRSHHAAEYLRRNGFQDVLNLSGGIHRWAEELDPAMAQYYAIACSFSTPHLHRAVPAGLPGCWGALR